MYIFIYTPFTSNIIVYMLKKVKTNQKIHKKNCDHKCCNKISNTCNNNSCHINCLSVKYSVS